MPADSESSSSLDSSEWDGNGRPKASPKCGQNTSAKGADKNIARDDGEFGWASPDLPEAAHVFGRQSTATMGR